MQENWQWRKESFLEKPSTKFEFWEEWIRNSLGHLALVLNVKVQTDLWFCFNKVDECYSIREYHISVFRIPFSMFFFFHVEVTFLKTVSIIFAEPQTGNMLTPCSQKFAYLLRIWNLFKDFRIQLTHLFIPHGAHKFFYSFARI